MAGELSLCIYGGDRGPNNNHGRGGDRAVAVCLSTIAERGVSGIRSSDDHGPGGRLWKNIDDRRVLYFFCSCPTSKSQVDRHFPFVRLFFRNCSFAVGTFIAHRVLVQWNSIYLFFGNIFNDNVEPSSLYNVRTRFTWLLPTSDVRLGRAERRRSLYTRHTAVGEK